MNYGVDSLVLVDNRLVYNHFQKNVMRFYFVLQITIVISLFLADSYHSSGVDTITDIDMTINHIQRSPPFRTFSLITIMELYLLSCTAELNE